MVTISGRIGASCDFALTHRSAWVVSKLAQASNHTLLIYGEGSNNIMQKLEIALLRATQLTLCLFYTSIVFIYVSSVVLIPLAVLMAAINILVYGIGFNGIFAFIVATPAAAWLFYKLYLIPNVADILLDTGANLFKMGVKNFRDFDNIARQLKGEQTPSQTETTSS